MKAYRFTFLGIPLLASVLAFSVPSRAQSAPSESEAVEADAQAARWLSAGNKAFKAGNFRQAEEAYRAAWKIKRGFDIAGDLGMSEVAQGKLREGGEHLAFSLRLFPITGDPAVKREIQKAYDRCLVSLSAVRLTVPVKGAVVHVDGVPRGEAPLLDPLLVEPGEHFFEAKLAGHTGVPTRLLAEKGMEVAIALQLDPIPVVTAPVPLPPAPPPPLKRRSAVPAIVLGGVAVAGIGTGFVLFGLSAGARADGQDLRTQFLGANKNCLPGNAKKDSQCQQLSDDFRRSDSLHNAAIGTTLVGVTAVAGAAAYVFWPAGARVRAAPVFGGTSNGLVLSGNF